MLLATAPIAQTARATSMPPAAASVPCPLGCLATAMKSVNALNPVASFSYQPPQDLTAAANVGDDEFTDPALMETADLRIS